MSTDVTKGVRQLRFPSRVVTLVALLVALVAAPGISIAGSGSDNGKSVARDHAAKPAVKVGLPEQAVPDLTQIAPPFAKNPDGKSKPVTPAPDTPATVPPAAGTPPANTTTSSPASGTQESTIPASSKSKPGRRTTKRTVSTKSPKSRGTATGADGGGTNVGDLAANTQASGGTNSSGNATDSDRKDGSAGGRVGSFAGSVATRIVEKIPILILYALAATGLLTLILAGATARERYLRKQLLAQSMIDGLTGIANREGFDRTLELEWSRSTRYGTPLSIAFIDLNQFKEFNDSRGHLAGDRLLRQVAATITAAVRDIDTTGRLGGDEFVVLCPETSASGMRVIRERIEAAAAELPVGLSVGAASREPSDESHIDLVARADQSMYEVKRETKSVAARIPGKR